MKRLLILSGKMKSEQDKILDQYDKDIKRDLWEIDLDKRKFIDQVKSGLGEQMKNIENYKKTPSRRKILWARLKKILWSE